MADDTSLNMNDLQEALKSIDPLPANEGEKLTMPDGTPVTYGHGEDLTKKLGEPEPPPPPMQEPEPEPEPEPVAEPVQEEPASEPAAPVDDRVRLTPEELATMYTVGKVNGEEKEYTFQELLNIAQTQDAASDKLSELKALLREARQSVIDEQPVPQPVHQPVE